MQITLHQTFHAIADFKNILKTLQNTLTAESHGIHLFPELYLTGYPLLDLCLQRSFIEAHEHHLQDLSTWSMSQKGDWVALVGGLHYQLTDSKLIDRLTNVIYEIRPGKTPKPLYAKRLLPNYDIFDEQKYFSPGEGPVIWQEAGKNFALMICEDMWASSFYHLDPCEDILQLAQRERLTLDGIINLSASPFDVNKQSKRIKRAQELSHTLQAPFFYVNRVGAEDEVLFDGSSFVVNGDDVLAEAQSFKADKIEYTLPKPITYKKIGHLPLENTWESLFHPQLSEEKGKYHLTRLTDQQCEKVIEALIFGLQEYAAKNGFKSFLVALSGGLDSTVVLTLAKLGLREGQKLEAIFMPAIHTSTLSYELSRELCEKLHIRLTSLPIKFFHSSVKNAFITTFTEAFDGMTEENIQSRLRGMLLYTRSNQSGSMVINTSNKSELAVGYSTQYGDSVGALSLLGDLYKTEVYRLAEYINQKYKGIIPEGIIQRPPTAELKAGQTDQDSLPPYDRLDTILEGILSYRLSSKDLVEKGSLKEEVKKVLQLYSKSEYKRAQFCPILKVKSKSFGFGYRVPISKTNDYYFE